jgi:multidrug efflux system membrane fusion protein
VKKGDLLFVIDQRPYRAALAQAQAALERSQSEAKLAASQNARAQTLIEAKVISREEYDARAFRERAGRCRRARRGRPR